MIVDMTRYFGIPLNSLAGRPYAYLDAIANHRNVTISQYNQLLTLYMARGDVIRNAIHSLRARREVAGTLSPADTALLDELEQSLKGEESA